MLDPIIKLEYDQRRPDGRLKLTVSAFDRLGQYAGSPGHRTYFYAELAVSSLVTAVVLKVDLSKEAVYYVDLVQWLASLVA